MLARPRIVTLLLVVAALPAAAAAAPGGTAVGTVVSLAPEVQGTMPPQGPTLPLGLQSPICLHMEVATQAGAGARIRLGIPAANAARPPGAGTPVSGGAPSPDCTLTPANLPAGTGVQPAAAGRVAPPAADLSPRGVLIMGPSSKVVVEEWLVEEVTRPEVTLRALVGEFLVFFTPRPRTQIEGKVQIKTRAGTLELHGTALCLRVAPDGTTRVAVLEGEVIVTANGGARVRVAQGNWTELAPDRPPRPPSPLDPRLGTLSPEAGGPAFTMPGETLVQDPPDLDLRRLASDLPKVRHP
jgi:hypothetical protein